MKKESNAYWEHCWKNENPEELYRYLQGFYKANNKIIDIFKEHELKKICDAGCGFGAYTLAFASHGFLVHSFDISQTSVKITQDGLKQYGIDASNVKVASILDTGYQDAMFDGVVAHAVIDHLTVKDAKRAIMELQRITRKNGLIFISFDEAESEDFEVSHQMIENGTMQYIDGERNGMIFHPYEWKEIDELCKECNVIFRECNSRGEKLVILKNAD